MLLVTRIARMTQILEPRAARGIASQEIKQINLNLGAEPRNSGSLEWPNLVDSWQVTIDSYFLSFSIFLLSLVKRHWTSFDHLIDVNKMVGHWLPQVDYRLPPSCSTKLMQAWLCTRSCVGSRRPFSPCWWHRNTGTGNFGFRVIRGRKAEAFLVILGLQLNSDRFNINFND